MIITAKAIDREASEAKAAKGVAVITLPENRWGRADIKSVNLLPNAMAKQAARAQGAAEAWYVDDMGLVTEGASSNAWIIDQDGTLRTRDTNANILRGITRSTLLDLIWEQGLKVDHKPFNAGRGPGRQGGLHHRGRHARAIGDRGGRQTGWGRQAGTGGGEAAEPLYRAGQSFRDLNAC